MTSSPSSSSSFTGGGGGGGGCGGGDLLNCKCVIHPQNPTTSVEKNKPTWSLLPRVILSPSPRHEHIKGEISETYINYKLRVCSKDVEDVKDVEAVGVRRKHDKLLVCGTSVQTSIYHKKIFLSLCFLDSVFCAEQISLNHLMCY